jgi:hypothetical protein
MIVRATQGNLTSSFVEDRRLLLEEFLKKTVAIQFLYQSDEFQLFIRNQEDFEKASSKLKRPTIYATAINYCSMFFEYSVSTSIEMEQDIAFHYNLFTKTLRQLELHRTKVEAAVETYRKFKADFTQLFEELKDFEGACVNECGLDFQQLVPSVRKTAVNPYKLVKKWLKAEILDVQAILECIDSIETFKALRAKAQLKLAEDRNTLQKLQTGKRTFGSFFSTKSKPTLITEHENSIRAAQEELHDIETLLRIITCRLSSHEIPHFKDLKSMKFEMIVYGFATSAVKEYDDIAELCQAISAKAAE